MNLNLIDGIDIFINKQYSDTREYFDDMYRYLFAEGKVNEQFRENIIKREKKYPTGLDTGIIKVAIPHTDFSNSNVTQLVVTTFKKPVKFKRMDDYDKSIPINIAIMILFNSAEKQPEMLQYIMNIVQNQNNLEAVLREKNKDEMKKLFKEFGGLYL
ncbi:PTS lactose transporter subunit IIBC [Oenococcus oeni]|uniref:PTS sugar transporter subunit IIA n=1 Tax=Oenococcus oeni TaxID=1247 RepID=UPI0008F859ED|nr:PTS sugar transporter subunit IIA [Oenococcus oeni]OIK85249.1 PTS lactose transporter subunit IIBC [Oenococcus oeni]OIL08287.1 PTS lactose transporter subunit IIBC [Oenococcus oeni]OIL11283.1 PTS lactose transporter subunit IIBC [Oenococcus oeni]